MPSPQPLPDDNTQLNNQALLKQLSEKARRGHAHAFKICKKYQVCALGLHGVRGTGLTSPGVLPCSAAAVQLLAAGPCTPLPRQWSRELGLVGSCAPRATLTPCFLLPCSPCCSWTCWTRTAWWWWSGP